MRRLFKVSTKAAIFSRDFKRVLVVYMSNNDDYGLPGGHIDEGETPDEAIRRELYEECGIESIDLERSDFFMHSNGKLILAYVGVCDNDMSIASKQNNLEGQPKWLTKTEFENIKSIEQCYRDFVLNIWSCA